MKSLLYIANLRLPTEKAYGIQITKMCEAFADSDQEVLLFHPYRKNPAINQNIFSYYSIKNNFSTKEVESHDFYGPGFLDKIVVFIKNYFSARALVSEALKEKTDIYYTRDEFVAYLLSKKNKNVIFECHRFSNKRKLFYSHFKKINLKIVAISNGLKGDLVKFGIKESNVLVAHDGVNLKEFDFQITKDEARQRLFKNLHHNSFLRKKIAVYVGQLYPWKVGDIFQKIAKHLCEENVNYLIFIFGGTGKKDPNALRTDIEHILKETHPNMVPVISLGLFPHRDVPYILKAADCAILIGNELDTVSAKYTSPLKMFEYMASGCPIVAQDLPSFREVLNDENSFLVKPGDAKALADKIAWVFKDENVKTAEGKAARAFEDVQQYTWQKRAEKILNFIQ